MAKQNDDDKDWIIALFAIPGVILLIMILMIPFALFNAWVSKTLYDWFILPLGAPALTIWHMWGIALLVSRFTPTPEYKEGEGMGKALGKLAGVVIGGLLALLVGYFVKGMI